VTVCVSCLQRANSLIAFENESNFQKGNFAADKSDDGFNVIATGVAVVHKMFSTPVINIRLLLFFI
jgi:hypothetical protein